MERDDELFAGSCDFFEVHPREIERESKIEMTPAEKREARKLETTYKRFNRLSDETQCRTLRRLKKKRGPKKYNPYKKMPTFAGHP